MNKLEQRLLEITFPNVNSADFGVVIDGTKNSMIATEILCGLYEWPTIGATKRADVREANVTFKSYDPFTNRVTYTFNRREERTYWIYDVEAVHLDVDGFPVVDRNLQHWNPETVAKSLGITVEELKANYSKQSYYSSPKDSISEDDCDLSNW